MAASAWERWKSEAATILPRNLEFEGLGDIGLDDDAGARAYRDGIAVHNHELLAEEVVDKSCRGIDHKARPSHDQHVRLLDCAHGVVNHAVIEAFSVEDLPPFSNTV